MPQPLLDPQYPRYAVDAWLEGLLPFEFEHVTEFAHCAKRPAMSSPGSPRKRARRSPERVNEGSQSSVAVTEYSLVFQPEALLETIQVARESLTDRSRSTQLNHGPKLGFPNYPAAASSGESPFSDPPPLSPTRSEASATTAKTGTTQRSRWNKSPVKSTADLFLAAKPCEYTEDMELPRSLKDLGDVKDNIKIVPAVIKDEVEKAAGPNERVREWMIDSGPAATKEAALRELGEIQFIVRESRYCQREGASEAAWNDGVTSRVLFLALASFPSLRHHNITTARPESSLVPKDLAGDAFDGKLVDYSINLVTQNHELPAQASMNDLADAIRKLLSRVSENRKAINQTFYQPVRFSPAGVTIETKANSAVDGRAQLSIWVAAWIVQMHHLRTVAANPDIKYEALEKDKVFERQSKRPLGIQLPLIVATGSSWKLYLALETSASITISSMFTIGDTSSVLGVYRLVKSLRILAACMTGPFLGWIKENILCMHTGT